jgi:hypothetical protein
MPEKRMWVRASTAFLLLTVEGDGKVSAPTPGGTHDREYCTFACMARAHPPMGVSRVSLG